MQVKKQFKVNLTFRQLMESYRGFDALAEFLDATLPPDPWRPSPRSNVRRGRSPDTAARAGTCPPRWRCPFFSTAAALGAGSDP